jgi:hypothetical protein
MWLITTVGPCALGDHHSTPLALLAGKGEGAWRDARLRGERQGSPRRVEEPSDHSMGRVDCRLRCGYVCRSKQFLRNIDSIAGMSRTQRPVHVLVEEEQIRVEQADLLKHKPRN